MSFQPPKRYIIDPTKRSSAGAKAPSYLCTGTLRAGGLERGPSKSNPKAQNRLTRPPIYIYIYIYIYIEYGLWAQEP